MVGIVGYLQKKSANKLLVHASKLFRLNLPNQQLYSGCKWPSHSALFGWPCNKIQAWSGYLGEEEPSEAATMTRRLLWNLDSRLKNITIFCQNVRVESKNTSKYSKCLCCTYNSTLITCLNEWKLSSLNRWVEDTSNNKKYTHTQRYENNPVVGNTTTFLSCFTLKLRFLYNWG